MVGKEQFEVINNSLLVRAPAKINLSLLIAGKRPDGFHEIETIMAKVDWCDEIVIVPGTKSGIELVCEGPCWAPPAPDNLAYKACKLFMESTGLQADLKITLRKNVPAGTGLGSASSDAAATLIGLNEYLQASKGRRWLSNLARTLGSDVAFFFDGPLAFCTGAGENVKKLGGKFDFLAVLLVPDVSVSTKRVYAHYKHDPDLYQALSSQIRSYIKKNRIDLAARMCANMLEESCFELYKELAKLKAEVTSLGVRPLCLSGSGSAMLWITQTAHIQTARQYQHYIQQKTGCKAVIVSNNRW